MFRPIKKKRNALSGADAETLLAQARRGILAVNGDDGYPYAIPINYYYDQNDRKIYFHGAPAGHKIDALKKSDKVCFTVLGDEVIKDEAWAPYVRSTVVFGRCTPITDPSVALAKLRQFAMKYYPDEASVNEEISISGKGVQMFQLEIEHLSGKEAQER